MKKRIHFIPFIVTLFIIIVPVTAVLAQTIVVTGPYHVQQGSRIWIEGSTSVNEFTCTSNQIDGFGHLKKDSLHAEKTSLTVGNNKTKVSVSLPDYSLDCGKRQMNHDMYNALKAEKFPTIYYNLDHAQILTTSDSTSGWFKVQTTGHLTIAGKTNMINMIVDGRMLPNGRFHIKGKKKLKMSTFDIDPPSPFWGLIKTHDIISVNFDLYVAPENIHEN